MTGSLDRQLEISTRKRALELGFEVTVVEDACRAVNVLAGDGERALEEMKEKGAKVTKSDEVIKG